jgi:hypothetical protein
VSAIGIDTDEARLPGQEIVNEDVLAAMATGPVTTTQGRIAGDEIVGIAAEGHETTVS